MSVDSDDGDSFGEPRWPDDPHDFDPCVECGAKWDEDCGDNCSVGWLTENMDGSFSPINVPKGWIPMGDLGTLSSS